MARRHSLRRALAIALVRPYTRHELPAWGRLYNRLVGGHRNDAMWAGAGTRWMRGKLHGYEMLLDLTRWSPRKTFFLGRFYDLGTQTLVQALLRRGDTFVDIGANEGMISLLAARLVGATGRVISFEPNPGPRGKLEAAIERNGIQTIDVRAMGLADRASEMELHVPRFNSGEGSFGGLHYDAAKVDAIRCAVRVGDEELSDATPRLIKIDVEGFETLVLRGLTRLIDRTRPFIVTEVVSTHLRRAGSDPLELGAFFEERGYRPLALGLRRRGLRHQLLLSPASLSRDHAGDVLWVPDEKLTEAAIRERMG